MLIIFILIIFEAMGLDYIISIDDFKYQARNIRNKLKTDNRVQLKEC